MISKEVIDGETHYYVDWYPTFMLECELEKPRHLVQEYEAKEQRKKHRGRP
jgi:hypothetical protein